MLRNLTIELPPIMRSFRETIFKASLLGLVIGGGIGWRVSVSQADTTTTALIKNYLGWPVDAANVIAELVGQGLVFQSVHNWLLGPALPATAGFVAFVMMVIFLCASVRNRPLVDYVFPAAPDILDPRLERLDTDPIDARAQGMPFVAREEDMRNLLVFAGKRTDEGPAFMVLHGREGVGKTRLGIEWLKRLEENGWDTGILEPQKTVQDIERAIFRRKTAILVDDPGKVTDFWPLLDALLKKGKRIRILLADQVKEKWLGKSEQLR